MYVLCVCRASKSTNESERVSSSKWKLSCVKQGYSLAATAVRIKIFFFSFEMHKHFSRGIYLPDPDDYIKRKFRLLFHVDVFRFLLLPLISFIFISLLRGGRAIHFLFPRFHVINYALSCLAIVVISENKMRFQIRMSTI